MKKILVAQIISLVAISFCLFTVGDITSGLLSLCGSATAALALTQV